MKLSKLRIATRKSPLALWQAEHIKTKLLELWPGLLIELVPMTTSGDKFLKDKLLEVGGKGLFVKELEEALLASQADIAVHSMKDVPAMFPQGLFLAAICQRENPFDVLISKDKRPLAALEPGSIIGTSSLRRQSQLLAWNNQFKVKTLRGNVQTRLAQLDAGNYDAIILAAAGIHRLGLTDRITEILPPTLMLPACGQGALGIECREGDTAVLDLIAPLNHEETALCVKTERLVNAQLGGNCHVPLAVYCKIKEATTLILQARVLNANGEHAIASEKSGSLAQAKQLAQSCASHLLDHGARALLGGDIA